MKFRVTSPYENIAENILSKYPAIQRIFVHEIDDDEQLFVEINTLEELMRFKNVTCDSIVIDEEDVITIYDGYIE